MKVKTISQLPECTINPSAIANSYIEMSIQSGSGSSLSYTSNKGSLNAISQNIQNALSSSMKTMHGLYNGSTPIKSSALLTEINNIKTANMTITGKKTFATAPIITNLGSESNSVATRADCQNFAATYSTGISNANQTYDKNGSVTTTLFDSNGSPYSNRNGYIWHIDDQSTDSSTSKDEVAGSIGSYVQMKKTGMLVMWGWLADNGNVRPQDAWVALYAKIKDNLEVPIMLQPWIQGKESSKTLQYVGFTVPVKSGLNIKVKTGFPVNGQTGGGFQTNGTMTFRDAWIPNSFFGYIIA